MLFSSRYYHSHHSTRVHLKLIGWSNFDTSPPHYQIKGTRTGVLRVLQHLLLAGDVIPCYTACIIFYLWMSFLTHLYSPITFTKAIIGTFVCCVNWISARNLLNQQKTFKINFRSTTALSVLDLLTDVRGQPYFHTTISPTCTRSQIHYGVILSWPKK